MLFVNYPKCTTCQKAKRWLTENGFDFIDRDIKADRPCYEELKKWIQSSGLPIKRFFNTSGLLYKSLQLKDRLPAMTDEEKLELLASDGMLVKRPLLIDGETVLVGFKPDQWEQALKK